MQDPSESAYRGLADRGDEFGFDGVGELDCCAERGSSAIGQAHYLFAAVLW